MPPTRHRIADPRLARISGLIGEARERAGLTLAQAGERLGIGWAAFGDLERCRKPPTLERLWAVAEALGIDPHDLDERLAPADLAPKKKKPRAS